MRKRGRPSNKPLLNHQAKTNKTESASNLSADVSYNIYLVYFFR